MGKTQVEKIYELLAERGERGASNIELNRICFRYGARIKDMRDKGVIIKTVRIKGSLWKFYLIEPEQTVDEMFDNRVDNYAYEQQDLFDMLQA